VAPKFKACHTECEATADLSKAAVNKWQIGHTNWHLWHPQRM